MLISAPFLKSATTQDTSDSIQLASTGQYPVTSYLEWHNGLHLIAPQENGLHVDVRAIADGTVIYTAPADPAPSENQAHPQNYAAFGSGPEWTDKGFVVVEHKTEIGADGNAPTEVVFYSVYAHLKEIAAGIAKDKKVFRKDILGKPGQIYSQPGHIHFEICLNNANIEKLLGQDPNRWPAPDAEPTKDGRIDAVFGSTYVYLPAGTPVQTATPTHHTRGAETQTLSAPQWVQITYAGKATLTSYTMGGTPIGATPRTDPDAEYDLYNEANTRHNSLGTSDKAASSPSGWYELLRFGRNLGRGPGATDKDPLPVNAAHWRKINTPNGEKWADLNASGTFKFSDADFPAFLGWTCYGDDTKAMDQRCDSPKLKALLTSQIGDPLEKEATLKDHAKLFRQTGLDSIKAKLRNAICKFPTEFDQGNFQQRYGHIEKEEYFQTNTGAWTALEDHIEALTFADLPAAYKEAQWHVHPLAFIEAMRQCGWLQKSVLKRIFTTITDSQLETTRSELNKFSCKHFLNTGLRQAHFFGQVLKETGPSMGAITESLNYSEAALRSTFRFYYGSRPVEANQDGRTAFHAANQETIANKVYAGRIGNGNFASGDGWLYRGRGMKQVTGRGNYRDFKKQYQNYWATGLQDFEGHPDLLVQAPYALRSAVWFWVSKGCMKMADGGMRDRDVDAVTGIVNHGELGTPKAIVRRNFAQAAYETLE